MKEIKEMKDEVCLTHKSTVLKRGKVLNTLNDKDKRFTILESPNNWSDRIDLLLWLTMLKQKRILSDEQIRLVDELCTYCFTPEAELQCGFNLLVNDGLLRRVELAIDEYSYFLTEDGVLKAKQIDNLYH